MAPLWMLVEVYRENGQTHRELVEGGLEADEAREMAAGFNQNMVVIGITKHWVEAVPEPA